MTLQNVANLTSEQLKAFLDSFDNVLCDCDGVLWILQNPIPGVKETISLLRKNGKSVRFVSNNSAVGVGNLQQIMTNFEFESRIEDIAVPSLAIISYLKSIHFDKEIFVIGTNNMKKDLTDAGFTVADSGPSSIEESYAGLQKMIEDKEEVGAVIFDLDINLNYIKLIKALVYIQRPEVLFINGASDKTTPSGGKISLIGPGPFQDMLENFSSRVPLQFGKPSVNLEKYFTETFGISDNSRTLFIGDSLEQDMGFASACGYQKLLVLTGISSLEHIEQSANKDLIPDYYINSFGDLHDIIKNKI